MAVELSKQERFLLDWLGEGGGVGQYGECHGSNLDSLISKGLATVGDEASGLNNGFIAKGTSIMYRTVSLTEAGLEIYRARER